MRVEVEHGLSFLFFVSAPDSINWYYSYILRAALFDLKGKQGKLALAVEEEEGYVYH